MKWKELSEMMSFLNFWNLKEFYSLFIAFVTRSPLFSKLRTCKVFGTLSTRINVTFGILPFLSLGIEKRWASLASEVSTLWTVGLVKSTHFEFCILTIEHHTYLQQFWYVLLLLCLDRAIYSDRDRDHCCLVFIFVWQCLCDSWWMTAQGQRKQHQNPQFTILRGNTFDRYTAMDSRRIKKSTQNEPMAQDSTECRT